MNQPSKGSAGKGKLIGRIVLYSVLLVACVVVVMQYKQNRYAANTSLAIQNRIESPDEGELNYSELAPLIQGTPSKDRVASTTQKHASKFTETLTWKGPIYESSIIIYLGLPDLDLSVRHVEGPGAEEEAQ